MRRTGNQSRLPGIAYRELTIDLWKTVWKVYETRNTEKLTETPAIDNSIDVVELEKNARQAPNWNDIKAISYRTNTENQQY